ncbi:MAG: GGDEF domain-containing protein [Schwartzia sp.]|nr:GGDEF domain-containing protein [Schwartzia sp. (in: firmicutes)]
MYSAKVHFWLAGFGPEEAKTLMGVEPLERFKHTFMEDFSLDALRADVSPAVITVVVADEAAGFAPGTLREAAGAEAKLVWCAADAGTLSGTALSSIDAIWGKPLTPALLAFHFASLQKRLKLEKDKWLAETYLSHTIDPVPDLIWYKDVLGAHLMVNDAFCEVVGKTKEDIAGRGHCYIWGLTPEEYAQGEYVCMETEVEVIQQGMTCVFDEQVKAPEGMRLLKTYKTPIRDVDGRVMGTVGVARNVTKEREYEQKILEMAQTDSLTGLANRRHLESYMKGRESRQKTFVYFDLDHFKQVNDTHGHETGDMVLVQVAERMKQAFEDGFLVRLGGDEFLAVFLDEIPRDVVEKRVGEFIESLQSFFEHTDKFEILSTSAGIAIGDKNSSLNELLRQSDFALYAAKRGGRACCRFYDPSMAEEACSSPPFS